MKDMIEIKRFEILPGSNINRIAEYSIEIAKEFDCLVEFKFNDVLLRAYSFSTPEELTNYYYRKLGKNKKE